MRYDNLRFLFEIEIVNRLMPFAIENHYICRMKENLYQVSWQPPLFPFLHRSGAGREVCSDANHLTLVGSIRFGIYIHVSVFADLIETLYSDRVFHETWRLLWVDATGKDNDYRKKTGIWKIDFTIIDNIQNYTFNYD